MPTTLAMTTYLENKIADHVLRNTAYTSPTTVYAALYTTDPGEDDSGTEVTGGSYARVAVTFGAPVDGVTSNTGQVAFPTATGSWGTVGWMQIMDALSSGNALFHGALETAVTINSGDSPLFQIGDLQVTFQ